MSEDIVSIGAEKALCVNVHNSFGVVCLRNQGLQCATCKRPSCKHVTHLRDVMDSVAEEAPDLFADFQVPSITPQTIQDEIGSSSKISFSVAVDSKQRLKNDHSSRFNFSNGIANLYPRPPSSPSNCPKCSAVDSWSEQLYLTADCFLVL